MRASFHAVIVRDMNQSPVVKGHVFKPHPIFIFLNLLSPHLSPIRVDCLLPSPCVSPPIGCMGGSGKACDIVDIFMDFISFR